MITVILSIIFINAVLIDTNPNDLNVCELTHAGIEHLDTLSKANRNLTCLHWNSLNEMDDLFKPFGGSTTCQNFCRNLDKHLEGAYCIVKDTNNDLGFSSEHCRPKDCALIDRTNVGVGNYYSRQLKTRTKRSPKSRKIKNHVFTVENNSLNTVNVWKLENISENSSTKTKRCWEASNKHLRENSCFVKDSDRPLGCTLLVSTYLPGMFFFILPLWRKNGLKFWLKAWNAHIYEGLIMSMASIDALREYLLIIGDKNNQKVTLYYRESGSDILLQQNILTHLIPSGVWKGYWLRPGYGKIELGYEGESNSFFEWTYENEELAFQPMTLNLGTVGRRWIAISFQCMECLTAKISVEEERKRYPINIWRGEVFISNLILNLRGNGSAIITLMWTEDSHKYFAIEIFSYRRNILILRYLYPGQADVLADFPVPLTMSSDTWSEYIISYSDIFLTIQKDGIRLVAWKSPFYLTFNWFSVSAGEGWVLWSANCFPADIDGEPRNGNWGKWGPWSCSVTCGRGEGRLERQCNDPSPNAFGEYCEGAGEYYGICNDFPCGEISPATNDYIRNYLSTQHKSFNVDAKEKVVLPCNSKAVELVSAEVSELNISWTHNGFPFSRIKFHMDENYSLVIPYTNERHNGIYMCVVYQNPESLLQRVVLEVISLVVVKSRPTKKVRKGKSFPLRCNGLHLSDVYADLSQKWELNGTVWKDYGLGNLHTYNIDKLNNISYSHSGIWTCVVIQEDFRFKWTTNWIYLSVTSAPSLWSSLKEDIAPFWIKFGNKKTAIIFGFSALFLVILIISIICSIMRSQK